MSDETSRTRRRLDYARAEMTPARQEVSPIFDLEFPGWVRAGEFLYRRNIVFPGSAVDLWDSAFSPEAAAADQLVFYDTETTGLSGGAGTMIFLFGAAWCEGHDLRLEQLFLSDFPGELEFLNAVKDLLRPFAAWVSYNGKTFDSHLLRSRFLMNGMDFEPGPQVDLLHHARRLWRSITGECNLKVIETEILRITREVDVAGEDIPLVWLEFVRTGSPGILPVVFQHNMMDITSVARLYGVIGRLLRGEVEGTPVDQCSLGGWLLSRSPESGAALLRRAFQNGNLEAGITLSVHHKRRREWDQAAEIWQTILASSKSIFAAVELAKHLEHRVRDIARAMDIVEMIASWQLPLSFRDRREIRRRRDRLARKLAER